MSRRGGAYSASGARSSVRGLFGSLGGHGQGRGRLRRWARRAGLGGGVAFTAAVLALVILDRCYPFPLARLERSPSAVVDASDGLSLARRVAPDGQWRRPTPLADAGHWLPLATVAIEDRRFREHPGVDARGVLRAIVANLRSGRIRQGGSTLTMQLIGMTFATPRSLPGKAVEAFRAVQLERLISKDEVLERYLNLAPYGRNLCGIEAGAQHWFGKRPQDLALDEAALLAGLPQGPERLRPDRFPARALARRDAVLDAMQRAGFVTAEEHAAASAASLSLVVSAPPSASAFHAATWALAERAEGGRTWIEPLLQQEIERVVAAHVPFLPAGTDVAVVAIDVRRAAVVGLLGSADPRDPLDGQVNGARARRSPGSTLKPFVYAAALEAGRYTLDSIVEDTPVDLAGWRPANFDGGFSGPVTIADALRRSLNLPALRVAQSVGVERCVGLIEAAGASLASDAVSRAGLTLVTGGTPITAVELTNAYATLARGGEFVPTRLFVDEPQRAPQRVLSSATCAALNDALSTEHRAPRVRGGASQISARPFMWKTGTSSGNVDAWAIGHDGHTALGVWVGRFDGAGHPAYVGGEVAEPILAELFVSRAFTRAATTGA
ncbi:MAG: transglycosylase domain-containing protein [Planctomycetota bacterium]